jgi:uncharacterized lipoprotein YddW (UPF0748 family)
VGRRFEELADVCDAHELRLELHAWLASGRRGSPLARWQLQLNVWDGADGKTATHVGEAEGLETAAKTALGKLRRAGIA